MSRSRRGKVAPIVAVIAMALMAVIGVGSGYAATKINGRTIKPTRYRATGW